MKTQARLTVIGAGLVAGMLVLVTIRPERGEDDDAGQAPATPAGEAAGGGALRPGERPLTQSRARSGPAEPSGEFLARLRSFHRSLAAARTPEEARSLLSELQGFLASLDPSVAASVVTAFLDGGQDAELALPFAIGDSGFLDTPPTVRVALLDLLGRIEPAAAAALGRKLLATPTSADEWAVCLRNVARGEPGAETNEYLHQKAEQLIRNPEWQAAPSIGYLNAFDVLVHTQAVESVPLLSSLLQREDRRDLAHASFLALDGLTQRSPVEILGRLGHDVALHRSRPEMVAQQFARADLRDPAQRQLVRLWLLDPSRTQRELRAFSGVFPNNNQMVSTNLLTTAPPLSGLDLRAHDRAVLKIISAWQEDAAFQEVRSHLAVVAGRLRQFGAADLPPGGQALDRP